jgi:hypothetical protein
LALTTVVNSAEEEESKVISPVMLRGPTGGGAAPGGCGIDRRGPKLRSPLFESTEKQATPATSPPFTTQAKSIKSDHYTAEITCIITDPYLTPESKSLRLEYDPMKGQVLR